MSEPEEREQGPGLEKRPPSRSFVIAFRIILLLASASAVVAAVAIGLPDRTGTESGTRYACPMHPEARGPRAGNCPICGMALEPIGRDQGAAANRRGDMPAMPDMTAVENIRKHRIIDFVRRRSLPSTVREMRGSAWVDDDRGLTAIFYNDQVQALAPDEPGRLTLSRAPKTTISVRRTAAPVVAWDRSTSMIRFRLDPATAARATGPLSAGLVGWIELEHKGREVLSVPASAVIQSPEGPYVLAPANGGRFEKRPIEIGETFLKQGFAVVLSGLQLHDRVVSRAAFFLDADRRLGGRADVGQEDLKADIPGAP